MCPISLSAESTRQMPIESAWVGREAELQALNRHFQRNGGIGNHAVIQGPGGIGKTALSYIFCQNAKDNDLFKGGWHQINVLRFDHIPNFQNDILNSHNLLNDNSILYIDDYDQANENYKRLIKTFARKNPKQNILISTRRESPKFLDDPLVIVLKGFSKSEFKEVLARRLELTDSDNSYINQFYSSSKGIPLLADIANRTIRENLVSFQQFVDGLQGFTHTGIIGPAGEELPKLPKESRVVVVDTNELLLESIRNDPELIYSLEPRKFEEIVATSLESKGYEVTLTPPSKDGGFDMYAARRDDLGSFLYLVECKRYAPSNTVGVSIVRSLHGVVQQKCANAGIIVTSSSFTKGAKEFQCEIPHQMHLKDYIALQKLLGIL